MAMVVVMTTQIQTEQLNRLAIIKICESGQLLTYPLHVMLKDQKQNKTKQLRPAPHNTQMLHMWPQVL